MAHTTKEDRDIYYRRAKEEGFRARSAYKLLQIFESFQILYPLLDRDSALSVISNSSCSKCEVNSFKSVSNQAPVSSTELNHNNSPSYHLNGLSGSDDYDELGLTDYVSIKRNCLSLGRIKNVVDLCSAPGSWSQLLSKMVYQDYWALKNVCDDLQSGREVCKNLIEYVNLRPVIVSIDIQQMAPIEGVHFLKGDITDSKVLEKVRQLFIDNVSKNINEVYEEGDRDRLRRNAQLITCDGAPDISGLHETDAFLQTSLIQSALSVCFALLDTDGTFICKTFFGSEETPIFREVSSYFQYSTIFKPPASRSSSFEHFIVAIGYRPLGNPLRGPSDSYLADNTSEIDLELKEVLEMARKTLSWDPVPCDSKFILSPVNPSVDKIA